MRFPFAAVCLLPLMICASCTSHVGINVFSNANSVEEFRSRIPVLSLKDPPGYSQDIMNYFRYFRIDFPGIRHYFGTLFTDNKKIAVHCFFPQAARGTVFVIHGFILHSAILSDFIRMLLDEKFAVVAFDLPGHGLSEGAMCDIGNFDEYAQVTSDIFKAVRDDCPGPYYLLGHSTGGAAVISYMVSREPVFRRFILVSPLVRSAMYDLSQFGMAVLGWAIKTVPAGHREEISHDRDYLDFISKKDPLRATDIPLSWVRAMDEYNRRLLSLNKTYNYDVVVIQGNKDVVLEWENNLAIIKKLFPNQKLHLIDNGYHDLLSESKEYRDQVYGIIKEALNE
jgi:alpha-beta hydrolase superfamily lysophospholipase